MGHNCNSIEVVDLKHPKSKCMESKFVEEFTASSSSIGGILQDHAIICGGTKRNKSRPTNDNWDDSQDCFTIEENMIMQKTFPMIEKRRFASGVVLKGMN